MRLIIPGNGYPQLFLPAFKDAEAELIQRCRQRYSKYHAEHSEEPAANGNGCKRPYAGKSHASAHYSRVDDVALKLLEHDKEDNEYQCLHRVNGEDYEGAYACAEESSDYGDKGGNANESSRHSRIWQLQQLHANEAERAEYYSFHELSHKEALEGSIGGSEHYCALFIEIFAEIYTPYTVCVAYELILAEKQVYSEYYAEHKVRHS